MNLSEMRTVVRNLLNETSPGFWTNTQLNSYLNLSADRVYSIIAATREDFFTISATFQTTAGVDRYTFPTNCRYIRRLERYNPSDPHDIQKLDESRFPRTESGGEWPYSQNGIPKRYVVIGDHFTLQPVPDGTYDMRIYYDERFSDMAIDADTTGIPEEFHDMIVYWACLLAKKQNEEDDTGFGGLFSLRQTELVDTISKRAGEDPRFVEGFLEGI